MGEDDAIPWIDGEETSMPTFVPIVANESLQSPELDELKDPLLFEGSPLAQYLMGLQKEGGNPRLLIGLHEKPTIDLNAQSNHEQQPSKNPKNTLTDDPPLQIILANLIYPAYFRILEFAWKEEWLDEENYYVLDNYGKEYWQSLSIQAFVRQFCYQALPFYIVGYLLGFSLIVTLFAVSILVLGFNLSIMGLYFVYLRLTGAFMTTCKEYNITIRKCIRHIMEIELVSRGYGLSMPLSPITRLERFSKMRRCTLLRRYVLEYTAESMKYIEQSKILDTVGSSEDNTKDSTLSDKGDNGDPSIEFLKSRQRKLFAYMRDLIPHLLNPKNIRICSFRRLWYLWNANIMFGIWNTHLSGKLETTRNFEPGESIKQFSSLKSKNIHEEIVKNYVQASLQLKEEYQTVLAMLDKSSQLINGNALDEEKRMNLVLTNFQLVKSSLKESVEKWDSRNIKILNLLDERQGLSKNEAILGEDQSRATRKNEQAIAVNKIHRNPDDKLQVYIGDVPRGENGDGQEDDRVSSKTKDGDETANKIEMVGGIPVPPKMPDFSVRVVVRPTTRVQRLALLRQNDPLPLPQHPEPENENPSTGTHLMNELKLVIEQRILDNPERFRDISDDLSIQ